MRCSAKAIRGIELYKRNQGQMLPTILNKRSDVYITVLDKSREEGQNGSITTIVGVAQPSLMNVAQKMEMGDPLTTIGPTI